MEKIHFFDKVLFGTISILCKKTLHFFIMRILCEKNCYTAPSRCNSFLTLAQRWPTPTKNNDSYKLPRTFPSGICKCNCIIQENGQWCTFFLLPTIPSDITYIKHILLCAFHKPDKNFDIFTQPICHKMQSCCIR